MHIVRKRMGAHRSVAFQNPFLMHDLHQRKGPSVICRLVAIHI